MTFASAISQHPVPQEAAGEVLGSVMEAIGHGPDIALLFMTSSHGDAVWELAQGIDSILSPGVLVGAVTDAIVGTGQEIEHGYGVSLWAGNVGSLCAIELSEDPFHGWDDAEINWDSLLQSWQSALGGEIKTLLLFSDDDTFPIDNFLKWCDSAIPGIQIIGGTVPSLGRDGSVMLLGNHLRHRGAVAIAFDDALKCSPLSSIGSVAIGDPVVVTSSDGTIIKELAQSRSLDFLEKLAKTNLDQSQIEQINSGGLSIGELMTQSAQIPSIEDFRIFDVLGADPRTRAIAVTKSLEVGALVQFFLADSQFANERLELTLLGKRAQSSLVFPATKRGTNLFPTPHHDADALERAVGTHPVVGFFPKEVIVKNGNRHWTSTEAVSIALLALESHPSYVGNDPLEKD